MRNPYRDLLAKPGALPMSTAAFVARLPISMYGLGIVLLVSAARGSYGLAGAVAATYAVVQSLLSPPLARLVDRLGQRRVTLPLLGAHVAGVLLLLGCVEASAPDWALFAAAALLGPTLPAVGAMVRARWSYLVGRSSQLHTAYSLESIIDEVIFIVGPVMVTVLATQVHRLAGLIATVTLATVGALALVAQRSTEPPVGAAGLATTGSAIRAAGLRALLAPTVAIGAVFGSIEVATVAFADAEGSRAAAGPVLAVYAAGSLLAGLAYGAANWRAGLDRRFVLATLAFGIGVAPLALVDNLVALTVCVFIAGATISPTVIAGFGLAESLVRPDQVTEGLTWVSTAMGLGVAVGSSLSGAVVDAAGPQRALLVTVTAGVLSAVLAVIARPWLRPRAARPSAAAVR